MPKRRSSRSPEKLPDSYIPPTLPTRTGPVARTKTPNPRVSKQTAKGYEKREVLLPGIDDGPRAIAYGNQKLGGKLQFAHYRASVDELWLVIEHCAGECDGLNGVTYSDGRALPTPGVGGKWQYWWYPGTAAGQIDPNLAVVLPSWNEPFAGTAYAVVVLRGFGKWWEATIPDLLWNLRTRKCLMPDTGLFAYSTNFWDQWYDFVRWSEGKAMPASRVDAASFVAARTADAAAGRNTDCHLLLLEDQDPDDVIDTFRLIARAHWFWDSNKRKVVADRPATSVMTITDDHVADSETLELDRLYDVFDRANKVTIWYTDIANGWVQKPMSLATAAVDAGTEDAREEEHRLPHLHDPALVKTILTYLLNAQIFDGCLSERWLASTSSVKTGDVVTRQIESRGLTMQFRVMVREKTPDNAFEVELHQYDVNKFAEFVLSDTTKIASTFPDPGDAPPNVDLGSVSWAEEPYPLQGGGWRTRGKLTMTIPPFAFLQDVEVWVSINGGPSIFWFKTLSTISYTPVLWETGTYTLTLKTRNRVTQELSSGTVVPVTVNGIAGGPQPPGEFLGDPTNGWYWDDPPARNILTIPSSAWTGTNMTTFDAAKIADGVDNVTAFKFGIGDTPNKRYVTLDYGSAIAIREFEWVLKDAVAEAHFPLFGPFDQNYALRPNLNVKDTPPIKLYYADSAGGPWTEAGSCRPVDRLYKRYMWQIGASVGARRYWRFEMDAFLSEYNSRFEVTEVRAYTYGATDSTAAGYLITQLIDIRADTHKWEQRRILKPTSGNRITKKDLEVMIREGDVLFGGYATQGFWRVAFVQTIASNGAVSEPRMLFSIQFSTGAPANATGVEQNWVPQTQQQITLANGLNSNITITLGPGAQEIIGPTAAFTLGGFVAPKTRSALMVVRYAGAQITTIANEHASSTEANRITTFSGVDLVLRGPFILLLWYDRTAERWIPIAVRDNTNTQGYVIPTGEFFCALNLSSSDQLGTFLRIFNSEATYEMGGIWLPNTSPTTGMYVGKNNSGHLRLARGSGGAEFNALNDAKDGTSGITINGSGNVVIGGGAPIVSILSNSATWNPATVAAGGSPASTTLTVTGAAVGDKVQISFTGSAWDSQGVLVGRITSANTLTVWMYNMDPINALDAGSGTLSALVTKHT